MTPPSRPDARAVNPAIVERIERYKPQKKSMAEDAWVEVADFAREAVRKAQPSTPGVATLELLIVAQFANWCREQSLPLDPETILTPDWVDEYDRQKLRGSLARKDDRTRLRRVATAATRKAPWPQSPQLVRRSRIQPPYSAHELTMLATVADGQPTRRARDTAWAILALGLGCGMWPREMLLARAADIEVDAAYVVVAVHGEAPRRVPVLPRYAPVLRELSHRAPDARLVEGANRLDNIILKLRKVEGVRFQPTRMRITWLVDVMNTGLTVPEVVTLSGLSTTHCLLNLVPYLNRRPDDVLFRAIGGAP